MTDLAGDEGVRPGGSPFRNGVLGGAVALSAAGLATLLAGPLPAGDGKWHKLTPSQPCTLVGTRLSLN